MTTTALSYHDRMLALLNGRDPLEVQAATGAFLSEIVATASLEDLSRQPAPGEWSVWQVIAHLADTELVYGTRIRLILVQERPVLVGYDQDAWVARFGLLDATPAVTLARWQLLRDDNLQLYRTLTADERARVGLHSERGEESVGGIVMTLGAHDLIHIAQINDCLGRAA